MPITAITRMPTILNNEVSDKVLKQTAAAEIIYDSEVKRETRDLSLYIFCLFVCLI